MALDTKRARPAKTERSEARSFDFDRFVPYLLTRVTNRLSKSFGQALKHLGIGNLHWRVLAVLAARDGRPISELCAYTATDHSTLSRTVDRLEERGLVRRSQSSVDARLTEIFMTDGGWDIFTDLLPIATAQFEWAVRDIDQAEVDQMVETLRKMLKNIRVSPYG